MYDEEIDFDVPTDVFAIGFEEMVDLNASNIMSARYICENGQNSSIHKCFQTLTYPIHSQVTAVTCEWIG